MSGVPPMAPRQAVLSATPQQTLRARRGSDATTLNYTNALTRVFPPEIMSQIFIVVRDLNLVPGRAHTPYYLTPLVLGHVCSLWREIALSTPYLWTYFVLTLKPHISIETEFSMLKFYLQAAKEVPFSLNIGFFLFESPTATLDRCRSALVEGENTIVRGSTIVHLGLWGVESESWIHYFDGLQRIDSLAVSFKQSRRETKTLRLDQFRNLHKVKIIGTEGLNITLSPGHITCLILEKVAVELGLTMLAQCPNLTFFEFINPLSQTHTNIVVSRSSGPIFLQHLNHLSWTYVPCMYYSEVFPSLQLPALVSLVWCGYFQPKPTSDQEEDRVLRLLIKSLPTTLLSFEVTNGGKWSSSLLNIMFAQIPNTKRLRLSRSRHILISDVLSLLLSRPQSNNPQKVLLPSLEELIILDPLRVSNDGPEWREDRMILGVSHFFQDQKPGEERSFTVHFARSSGHWTRGMYDTYRLLRQRGYPFRVWTDAGMTRAVEDAMKGGRAKGRGVDRKRPPWR